MSFTVSASAISARDSSETGLSVPLQKDRRIRLIVTQVALGGLIFAAIKFVK